MAYTALYRKFRPLRFDDMVGQEHITRTLKNQIMQDRVGHAYLFNGGRGTGKTSSAKILARAINCLSPEDGEPCNKCEICKGILAGTLTDVVEMDAASNNSVEDIRTIRDEVNFLPTIAKYRVYIIDEVHMLSTGAFNALLKTLEEPPKHAKFLLATTEPQKLPATILSRCQRFDFKRISEKDIIKRLEIICNESSIKISKDALRMIAILAEGALRDAISILERCIQEETNNTIDENIVRELIGIPKMEYINKVVENIIKSDVQKLLLAIDDIIVEGKDLDNFLWEVIKYVRDILIYKSTNEISLYNEEEKKVLEELSKQVTKERLLNLVHSLSELANSIKWSTQKTIMLQTGLIKACIQEIQIEPQIQNTRTKKEDTQIGKPEKIKKESKKTNIIPEKQEDDIDYKNKKDSNIQGNNGYLSYWSEILDLLKANGKIVLYTNLIGTKAKKINDMQIGIEFSGEITGFAKTVLEQHENKEEIVRMVSKQEGKIMQIKYLEGANTAQSKVPQMENITSDITIPINIIDE